MRDRLMFNIYSNEGEKQKQNCPINKLLNFSMCHIKKFSIFLTLKLCALNCNYFVAFGTVVGVISIAYSFIQQTLLSTHQMPEIWPNTEILQRWTVKSLSFKSSQSGRSTHRLLQRFSEVESPEIVLKYWTLQVRHTHSHFALFPADPYSILFLFLCISKH